MKKKSEHSSKYRLLFGSDTEKDLLLTVEQKRFVSQEKLLRKIIFFTFFTILLILVIIFLVQTFIPSTVPTVYPPKIPLRTRPLHPGGLTINNINNQFGRFDGTASIGINGVVPGKLILSQQQVPNQDILAAEFGVTPEEISLSAPVAQNGLPLPPEIIRSNFFSTGSTQKSKEKEKIPVLVRIYPFYDQDIAESFIMKIRNTLPVLFESLKSTVAEKFSSGQGYFEITVSPFPTFVAANNFCSQLGPIGYNYSCAAQVKVSLEKK